MRIARMFGLAVLAAVAAMAFVGASSASAGNTVLCSEPDPGLSCTHKIENALVHYLATEPLLLSSLVNIKCEYSLLLGKVLTLAAPLVLHIDGKGPVYTNCKTFSGSACGVTTLTEGGLINILRLEDELADITGGSSVNVLVQCGEIIHCVYNGESLTGHGLGSAVTGGKDHVSYSEATVNKVEGFLCPSTSKLHALFIDLEKLYIRE